ncbi:RteC domain-containing protein [Flavobacterium sp.]
MKNFSSLLLADLEAKLSEIQETTELHINYVEIALNTTIKAIEKLKTFFNQYKFENKNEEIAFFKKIKPVFASKLIYYNELYNIETALPSTSKKRIKKHYTIHLQKLDNFHQENREFIKYYQTNSTLLDKKYFQRNKHDIRLSLDSSYFQSDYNFTTSHDYKVAQILANKQLEIFINQKLAILKEGQNTQSSNTRWTGSKVALVELMYAINTTKVINNGNTSLNELAKSFEAFFDIELGQFNRIYAEIRNRKTIEKTSFINSLKDNLSARIENADEI